MNALNPYTIHWFTLGPLTGRVRKHDKRVALGALACYAQVDELNRVCADKDKALAAVLALRGKLHKPYRAYIYTDKQFGQRRPGDPITAILTHKQIDESFIIN